MILGDSIYWLYITYCLWWDDIKGNRSRLFNQNWIACVDASSEPQRFVHGTDWRGGGLCSNHFVYHNYHITSHFIMFYFVFVLCDLPLLLVLFGDLCHLMRPCGINVQFSHFSGEIQLNWHSNAAKVTGGRSTNHDFFWDKTHPQMEKTTFCGSFPFRKNRCPARIWRSLVPGNPVQPRAPGGRLAVSTMALMGYIITIWVLNNEY